MVNNTTDRPYGIAAIGPYDVISVFKAFGVECLDASTGAEVAAHLERVRAEKDSPYAIVFVVDRLLEDLDQKTLERLSRGTLPAVTAIPALEGRTEASIEKIRRLAERAVGSDILKQ